MHKISQPEAHVNNISEFIPYCKGNTPRLDYKDHMVDTVWGYSHCVFQE